VNIKELGVQPLDGILCNLGLSNADIVSASTKQLTFKMVQKGRKGRRLTPNIQKKILEALNAASSGSDAGANRAFVLGDLFNY